MIAAYTVNGSNFCICVQFFYGKKLTLQMFIGFNICSFRKAPTDLTFLKSNSELEKPEDLDKVQVLL